MTAPHGHIHLAFGTKNKFVHGKKLLMLFTKKELISMLNFGMVGDIQSMIVSQILMSYLVGRISHAEAPEQIASGEVSNDWFLVMI